MNLLKINAIAKVIITIISVWIFGSFIITLIEKQEQFNHIGNALWWTIVTMTTVGYGDISPQTDLGRFIASIAMILGYATIAVPTGIISAEYSAMQKKFNNTVCPECSSEDHEDDSSFCKECGAKLE